MYVKDLVLRILVLAVAPGLHVQAQSLSGCPVLPANNIWNTPVDHLPVHANSANYVNRIGPAKTGHADFGAGLYEGQPMGIPFVAVPATQPKVTVTFPDPSESDAGPYPIPPNVPIEGGSDHHVLVVDQGACILYEMFDAQLQSNGSWVAGSGAVFNLNSNQLRHLTWTSADAAGLPILPGLARYDEVAAGEIRHALRFTAPQTQRAFVWPARHYASTITDTTYPPMGARFRLKASFNISTFSPDTQVILRALKTYGMILADNGSSWYVTGAPDDRWNNDHLSEFRNIHGSDFEAVDTSLLLVDANSGQVASSQTPVSVFRDSGGAVQAISYGSSVTKSAGGVVASDPGAAQHTNGDLYIVARDAAGSLWANVFAAGAQSWRGWSGGGGLTQGVPAIAVANNGTGYIVARDNWNSYWLTSYVAGGGFGAWTPLAGVFSTDPAVAAASDGSIYIIGKDTFNSLWSGRYIPGAGFQGWRTGGGILKGKPSLTVGTDAIAYVTARDNWDSLWMARVQGNAWLGWSHGGGVMSADPQIAALGNGSVAAVLLDPTKGVWYRGYTQGSANGWQTWVPTGGILQSFAAAGNGGQVYVVGKDLNNGLWWYQSTGNQWTSIGNRGLVPGNMAAAPR